ncbi:hypothetical protein [Kitasatospora cineracea]
MSRWGWMGPEPVMMLGALPEAAPRSLAVASTVTGAVTAQAAGVWLLQAR